MDTTEQTFISNFKQGPKDQCWEWQGEIKNKYGIFYIGKSKSYKNKRLAHRFSYEYFKGSFPKFNEFGKRICVCHTCDTPLCINPNHLFLGTQKDNVQDAVKKGRMIGTKGKKLGPHSEETKRKISQTLTGKKLSEETKIKISITMTGKNFGPHSEEHKKNLSAAMTGKKRGKYSKKHKSS